MDAGSGKKLLGKIFIEIICSIRKCREYKNLFVVFVNGIVDFVFDKGFQVLQLGVICRRYELH